MRIKGNKMKNQQLKTFLAWCNSNNNIRTVILTSSRANPDIRPDILSDYDLEVYVKDLSFCRKNDQWLEQFGKILVRWPLKPQETGLAGWITRLVQFKNRSRFDLQISDGPPSYHPDFDAGYKVLIDKDNCTSVISPPQYRNLYIKRPSEERFQDRVNAFYWNSVHAAKCLKRDELFYAKFMIDNEIRFKSFQVFIEWYIGINNRWSVTTNKLGRYFKRYIDKELWKQIEESFPNADSDNIWKALYKMIDLSGFLCRAVAAELGYLYPQKLEDNSVKYIKGIQTMDDSELKSPTAPVQQGE